jgi:hypothetical protein
MSSPPAASTLDRVQSVDKDTAQLYKQPQAAESIIGACGVRSFEDPDGDHRCAYGSGQ